MSAVNLFKKIGKTLVDQILDNQWYKVTKVLPPQKKEVMVYMRHGEIMFGVLEGKEWILTGRQRIAVTDETYEPHLWCHVPKLPPDCDD